jgi:hypothetical protein
MQVKATFFLPVKDNDGRDLSAEIVKVEREASRSSGPGVKPGTSRVPGRCRVESEG